MNIETIKKIGNINYDQLKLLEISRSFNIDLKNIRDKYGIKIVKDDTSKIDDILVENDKFKNFIKDINDLLIKYKLSNNFFNAIREKILLNKFISVPASNYDINLSGKNISITVYQRPTKEEWINIKKEVERFISSPAQFMKGFNYPNGTKVRRPKKDINKTVSVLNRIKAGESNMDIEFNEYDDENAKMSNKVIKRNKGKIKSIKRRYKEAL